MCSVIQSRPTLCDPMNCSQPGSSFYGIFQARILEWVAFASLLSFKKPKNNQGLCLLLSFNSHSQDCEVSAQASIGDYIYFKKSTNSIHATWVTTHNDCLQCVHKNAIVLNERKWEWQFGGNYTFEMEKAMAPHSSTLAWKIPWTEEPGRLQSVRSLRVRHDWVTSLSLFTFTHWRRKWQPTPVFLPGESQGRGSLVGCRLWGCTESDTIEVT